MVSIRFTPSVPGVQSPYATKVDPNLARLLVARILAPGDVGSIRIEHTEIHRARGRIAVGVDVVMGNFSPAPALERPQLGLRSSWQSLSLVVFMLGSSGALAT